jgi:hypothetical protein
MANKTNSMPKIAIPFRHNVSSTTHYINYMGAYPGSGAPQSYETKANVKFDRVKINGKTRTVIKFNGGDKKATNDMFVAIDNVYKNAGIGGPKLAEAFKGGKFERHMYSAAATELMVAYGSDYWFDPEHSTGLKMSFNEDAELRVDLVKQKRKGTALGNLDEIFEDLHEGGTKVEALYDSADSKLNDISILKQLLQDINTGAKGGHNGATATLKQFLGNYIETLTYKARNSSSANERSDYKKKFLEIASLINDVASGDWDLSSVLRQAQNGLREDGVKYRGWSDDEVAQHYLSMSKDKLDHIASSKSSPHNKAKKLVELLKEFNENDLKDFYKGPLTMNNGLRDFASAFSYGLKELGLELADDQKNFDFVAFVKDRARTLDFEELADKVEKLSLKLTQAKAKPSTEAKAKQQATTTGWSQKAKQVLESRDRKGFTGLNSNKYKEADLQNIAWLISQVQDEIDSAITKSPSKGLVGQKVLNIIKASNDGKSAIGPGGLISSEAAQAVLVDFF